jgi:hypothetical protein
MRELAGHNIDAWALTGGLAFEIHAARLGLAPIDRGLNDADFVAPSFHSIPSTLAGDFLFRHVHPLDPPGKMMFQMIHRVSALRIDVFRAYGGMLKRTIRADSQQVVSLEDLLARQARMLLDLAAGLPVPAKHARDYLRFIAAVELAAIETVWLDHRKPTQPSTFREVRQTLPGLIHAHRELLITPEYSKNPTEVCPRCSPTAAFPLADPTTILALLGYC